MSFRNQVSRNHDNASGTLSGAQQLGSEFRKSNAPHDNRNGMWRRPKHSSHNAYSTLPRKIQSTQLNQHTPVNGPIPETDVNRSHTISSGVHTMTTPREGLRLPIPSTRNQCPPLPPIRGDSSVNKNSERRLSDITYAELSLNQQRLNFEHNTNNTAAVSSHGQTLIAPISEGVSAELRVTSPTTVYATIGK